MNDEDDIDVCIQDFDELVDVETLPDKYQNGYWEQTMKFHNKMALGIIIVMICLWYLSLMDYSSKVL